MSNQLASDSCQTISITKANRLVKYIAQFSLLLATLAAAEPSGMPKKFGDFTLVEDRVVAGELGDKELMAEFRLRSSFSAKYADFHSRPMLVEAFQFADVAGAHAAFLASRPNNSVSPMIWHIEAATGGGVTVLEYHNYVLRFSGALPTVSSALEEMLAKLPGIIADEKPWDLSGRYMDFGSARMVLGPVSLARFGSRIPPSVVAFRLGATGRMAGFETPSGRMTVIVIEYPSEAVANERLAALAVLPRTVTRRDRMCVGVVLDPIDVIAAQELLADAFCGPIPFTFDPTTQWDGPLTLGEGLAMALAGFVLGAVVALIRLAIATRRAG